MPFLNALPAAEAVGCVVDVSPLEHNLYTAGGGCRTVTPEALRWYRPDLVLLMSPVCESEVRQLLAGLGTQPEIKEI